MTRHLPVHESKKTAMNAIDEAFLRAYQAPNSGPSPPTEPREDPPAAPTGVPEASTDASGELLYFQVWSESATVPAPHFSIPPVSTVLPDLTSVSENSLPAAPVESPATELVPPTAPDASAAAADLRSPAENLERLQQTPSADSPVRQPLSAFTRQHPSPDAEFRAGLEVDAFRWPAECDDLTTHWSGSLAPAVEALISAAESGRSLIGIAGASEGCGATTLTLCLARLAPRYGKSIALIDGDFTDPQLATRLGLAIDTGWEHVLSGASSLADNVIHSRADHVSLLPLVAGGLRASEMIDATHAPVTAEILRQHYDLVLVDLGSIAGGGQTAIARKIARQFRLEAALLTTDRPDAGILARVTQVAPELAAVMIGTIENQVPVAAAG